MHEKKNPNKPSIVIRLSYLAAFRWHASPIVVVMLLNALLFPQIERYSVKQVDYSEFLSMLDEGKIKSVQIEDTQIAFTPVEQIQDGKATYYTTNRVTADGKLKGCLHSREEIPLRGLHGQALEDAVRRGILHKPERHHLTERSSDTPRNMNQIGG